MQNTLGLITPMKSFPKQLLLDFEYAGEISVGKEEKKIQNQKTRTEEKEIKAGKRELLTAYSTGFKEQSFEVRDRSGCPALLDSQLHTHILCVILSHVYCFHQPTNAFPCYWGNLKKFTPA